MRCGLPQQRSKFLYKSTNQTCNFLYKSVFVKGKRWIWLIEFIGIIELILIAQGSKLTVQKLSL